MGLILEYSLYSYTTCAVTIMKVWVLFKTSQSTTNLHSQRKKSSFYYEREKTHTNI